MWPRPDPHRAVTSCGQHTLTRPIKQSGNGRSGRKHCGLIDGPCGRVDALGVTGVSVDEHEVTASWRREPIPSPTRAGTFNHRKFLARPQISHTDPMRSTHFRGCYGGDPRPAKGIDYRPDRPTNALAGCRNLVTVLLEVANPIGDAVP